MAAEVFQKVPLRFGALCLGASQAVHYNFSYRVANTLATIGGLFAAAHIIYAAIQDQDMLAVIGAVLFEIIATGIIPPSGVHFLTRLVRDVTYDIGGIPSEVRRWIPLAAGILFLLLVIKFVDPEVDNIIKTHLLPVFQ